MHRTPLRRILPVASALCVLPLLAGCFTYDTTVRLSPDGSGTVEQRVVLNGPMAEMVRIARAEAAEGGTQDEQIELCEAADLGEGVRLVSAEPIEEAERVGCRQVYAFADVNTLRLNLGLEGKLPEGFDSEEGVQAPDEPITFAFQRGSPATLVVRMPEQEIGGDEDGDSEDAGAPETPDDEAGRAMAIAMMREMMRGSRFSVQLVLSGDIVETDATYVDGGRVTLMEFDFDALLEDPKALERFMDAPDSSPEEMKALLANTPGIRVETREEVRIRFQ